jgi:hypothetical protein
MFLSGSQGLCCGVCELVLFYQIGVSSGNFSYGNLYINYFQNIVSLSAEGWIVFSDLVT